MKQEYCLNLSKRYCENWSTWEVCREIYANAVDADPEPNIFSPNNDALVIKTKTVPDIAKVLIMGSGTKTKDDDKVGVYGEGSKIAALVATRKLGSSLQLRLPDSKITFEFRDFLGEEVLYAIQEDAEPYDGYCVTVIMEGAGSVLDDRIRNTQKVEIIPKQKDEKGKIYCKGIYICEVPTEKALFSYNLPGLELNRDRNNAQPYSLAVQAGRALLTHCTPEQAQHIIKEYNSWEAETCLDYANYLVNASDKKKFEEAFLAVHGPNSVIATDAGLYHKCRELGYRPKRVGEGIGELLEGIIPRDANVLTTTQKFDEVKVSPQEWPELYADFERICSVAGLDMPDIKWFKDKDGEHFGHFVSPNTIWLNGRYLDNNNRFERIRTFIHELGHYQSKSTDISGGFEEALDLIAAKFAINCLDSVLAFE